MHKKANLMLALTIVGALLITPLGAAVEDAHSDPPADGEMRTTSSETGANDSASADNGTADTGSADNGTAENDAGPTNPEAIRRQELANARKAALEAFRAGRAAALEAYNASLLAIRASFLENKSAVIEACNEGDAPVNASEAQCIRDGLAPLKDAARAAMADARAATKAELENYRGAAMASFASEKARVDRDFPRGGPPAESPGNGADQGGASQRPA